MLLHGCGRFRRKIIDEQTFRSTKRRRTQIAAVVTIGLVSCPGGCVVAAQPHVTNALAALQNARSKL